MKNFARCAVAMALDLDAGSILHLARFEAIEELLDHMAAKGDVCFATPG